MTKQRKELIYYFVEGLLRYAKVKHAGNCLTMSEILQWYILTMFGIETTITNCKVIQGQKRVNHFYLSTNDNEIIDGTSSQFKDQDGYKMPLVYIGRLPDFYINSI